MSFPNILSLKKTAEALYIKQGLSNTIINQVEDNKRKTKESVKKEMSNLKEELNSNAESLEKSATGKFAKQAKKAIEIESMKVDSF